MADPRARWRLYCSIRTALERLTAALDDYELLWSFPESTLGAPLATAVDGPAVQSREPASVVGESSDEHCWRWYTYCPEEGLDMYSDRKQAQSAAQSIIGSYEVAAYSDGWHENMESVSWGMLVPVEQAQVVERKTAEPDDEFDEWVKYGLRPVCWVHPAPQPPAEGEVWELVAALQADANLWGELGEYVESAKCRRAAELLQQQHAELQDCRKVRDSLLRAYLATFENFNQQGNAND